MVRPIPALAPVTRTARGGGACAVSAEASVRVAASSAAAVERWRRRVGIQGGYRAERAATSQRRAMRWRDGDLDGKLRGCTPPSSGGP
jgi:hypothetical protein